MGHGALRRMLDGEFAGAAVGGRWCDGLLDHEGRTSDSHDDDDDNEDDEIDDDDDDKDDDA